MKTGLILEGGALRGMFTAGILDVLMQNGITFDGAVGVSAGAVFGCNFKSGQIGRVIRFNKKYCGDRRYSGLGSLLKTGDFFNVQFNYEEIPKHLDVFDAEAYRRCPMAFYVVVTDADTGRPVYHRCDNGDDADALWMRASASMPGLSNIVHIDGGSYSDGGTSDSVPLRYFESIGYDRNVVIATQPKGYRKEKRRMLGVMKARLRDHPRLYDAVAGRHVMYNETMDYLDAREADGSTLVIRPPEPLGIRPAEKRPGELERVYRIGVAAGERELARIRAFLSAE